MYIPSMKNIDKIFSRKEIKFLTPVLYEYIVKNKIVTFVPLSHVDKLMFDMSAAGAGIIGNYTVCSFRMKGVGTFMPGNKANPFSGKKGKLAFEEEVRLEMECGLNKTEKVIDALIKSHPYEEPAYEIYEFKKRSGNPAAYSAETVKKYSVRDLLARMNKKVEIFSGIPGTKISRFMFIFTEITESHLETAKANKLEAIISIDKLKYKIKLL
jgi:hypothetical protein